MAIWRTTAALTLVAVAVMTVLLTVSASAAQHLVSSTVVVVPRSVPGASAGRAPSGQDALRARQAVTPTQSVQLTIVGGPLELATTEAKVALERVSERDWVGVLPPVRVVDARGTHEGWDVRWSVVAAETDVGPVAGNRVRLEPSPPAVVAGLAEGLEAGSPGPARPHGRTLFSADPGSGGGTYEAGAAVSLRLPASIDATSVVVHLGFSLAP